MSMTDPIADMLTRIRNAVMARHADVRIPASKLKIAIADILKREGYIENFEVEEDGPRKWIKVDLKWDGKQNAIEGLERISKPGQRQYAGRSDLPKVRNGLGILIVSTSRGVMTDHDARKAGVGGELLCSIW
ncbi:MAG: 30S ribosomal protein S8 [Deltaproteobacteria bacterium]|nr:MAG: 30S ribosomal protein S8 [Deltaproteobacteria bacterium]